MTEIYLNKVTAYAEYENLVFSYKIKAKLKGGEEIIFIDDCPLDLTGSLNNWIKVKLKSHFVIEVKSNESGLFGRFEKSEEANQAIFISENIQILLPIKEVLSRGILFSQFGYFYFNEIVIDEIL
jgi:hypothetical protein